MEMQSTRDERIEGGVALARGLGWFSVGLGLAEVAAPRSLARLIGVRSDSRTRKTMRALGARELVQGVAILSRPRRSGPVWSRVVGDAIDLALLGWSLRGKRVGKRRVAGAIAAVIGVGVLDVITSNRLAMRERPHAYSITINRLPGEVYAYWSSLDDSDVSNVTFTLAPDGKSTEVRVEMPPTNPIRKGIAKLMGRYHPTEDDLRELKQVIETGEVVLSDASAHRFPHSAQPSELEGVVP
ncbi:MAG: hypothetical protein JWO36_1222 [Myxococcales bacterium]|nr:hypothetical protein [Myxococcales bacterium]